MCPSIRDGAQMGRRMFTTSLRGCKAASRSRAGVRRHRRVRTASAPAPPRPPLPSRRRTTRGRRSSARCTSAQGGTCWTWLSPTARAGLRRVNPSAVQYRVVQHTRYSSGRRRVAPLSPALLPPPPPTPPGGLLSSPLPPNWILRPLPADLAGLRVGLLHRSILHCAVVHCIRLRKHCA